MSTTLKGSVSKFGRQYDASVTQDDGKLVFAANYKAHLGFAKTSRNCALSLTPEGDVRLEYSKGLESTMQPFHFYGNNATEVHNPQLAKLFQKHHTGLKARDEASGGKGMLEPKSVQRMQKALDKLVKNGLPQPRRDEKESAANVR